VRFILKNNLSIEFIFEYTRFTFYTGLIISFIYFFDGDFSGWVDIMPLSAWSPSGATHVLFPLFEVLKNSQSVLLSKAFSILFIISAACCACGWKWRISSVLCLVFSIIVFGFKNSFGHVFKADSILIVAQMAFCLQSLCYFNHRQLIFTLQITWVLIFFLGAINKLRFSGLSWFVDNYTYDYVRANQIIRSTKISNIPINSYISLVSKNEVFSLVFGYLVMLYELFYPLIFLKRLRLIFFIFTIVFQASTYFFLGIHFAFYLYLSPIWLYFHLLNENKDKIHVN